MKLSIKYKLSAIILIFVIISVFITSFVAIYRNQKYFTIFFQKKSNEKKISYKNKREKLFYLYSELSSKYENLYKTNISNDFGRFCENIKSDLIIESLPAQTETLSALSSKYKSKNILLIEKNNIIQIANDINIWRKNINEILNQYSIDIKNNKNSVICENEKFYYVFNKIILKNGVYTLFFILSKNEIKEFLNAQKKMIEEILANENSNDEKEIKSDMTSFAEFAAEIMEFNIILNFLILAAGIALMIFSIKLLLTKLNNILTGIKEAKNKNMSYRVLNNTFINDEFDDFTEQFNSMMEHIENEKITELISVIKKLMPEEKIESSGFNFVSYYKPSKEIGGDFIDVFDINENKKAIVIADVVGKSFPAAFLMVLGMTSIKLLSKKFSYPPEFIFELNRFLRVNTPPGKWITMIYSILDTKTGEIEILNCGHPEAFIFSQNKITEFSSTFPMIGELSDEKFKKYIDDYKSSHTTKFKLAAGDLFFLYTDGLSDSVNNEKNYFNIKSSVDQSFKSDYSAEKLKNKIIEQLTEFSVKDDLTFLLITKQN